MEQGIDNMCGSDAMVYEFAKIAMNMQEKQTSQNEHILYCNENAAFCKHLI